MQRVEVFSGAGNELALATTRLNEALRSNYTLGEGWRVVSQQTQLVIAPAQFDPKGGCWASTSYNLTCTLVLEKPEPEAVGLKDA